MDKFFNAGHPQRTICVLRKYRGAWVALAIPQASYREWLGCFSLLEVTK
jgi:hypothetical protein